MHLSIAEDEIKYACITPDLRVGIISQIVGHSEDIMVEDWLSDAAKCNYEDSGYLLALANVMNKNEEESDDDDDSIESDSTSSEVLDESQNKKFVA